MKVKLQTSKGPILIQLEPDAAPKTVANFVSYVEEGFYDGTIFHRVIDGFMIQGGGYEPGIKQKTTKAPIENEATNGLGNDEGTVAMARTSDPHSASAQFFINVDDNDFLNHYAPTEQGYGYCVFGRVIEGMDAVNAIKSVPTGRAAGMDDVPLEDVLIESAVVVRGE